MITVAKAVFTATRFLLLRPTKLVWKGTRVVVLVSRTIVAMASARVSEQGPLTAFWQSEGNDLITPTFSSGSMTTAVVIITRAWIEFCMICCRAGATASTLGSSVFSYGMS